ncbi:small multidrug efflux protein [Labedella endophytica]|uniref:Small multidrug efflux protein n=1 Tax=Labedella endophytica TaxID=1523160 RepID=A0A3S0VD21_9MICO|nr:small multidrug efflux protein [Labedella endophytica]RUR03148.1 small multidrug efflux protein [Labedella endophytica]
MNLIDTFQDLVAQVPEFLQPLIVVLAGAVPFIEGEGATTIGIIGGIHPIVAAIAAIIGNFACVALLVLLGSGARDAVVSRRRAQLKARESVVVGGGSESAVDPIDASVPVEETTPRKAKFQRAFERYGVPGVSLLGPLLLPTQFTATMLAAAGVTKARILLWQGIAIVAWTTAFTILISSVVNAVH